MTDTIEVICPKCGKVAKNTQTKYGIRSYCCNLWSWKGAPLADKKTHKARIKAHRHFDILWKTGFLSRSEAYNWLSKTLNISKDVCHMKLLNYEQCKKVIRICRNFEKSMEFRK